MAEVTVGSLIVNLSCGRLKSETFSASVKVGGAVAEGDIQRVLGAGGAHSVSDGRMVLHSLPIGYALDANRGIHDPIGMLGETLGVDMHVVTADEAPLRNLELAINRCHLEIETVVATPYASGLAALVDDEARARRRAASTWAAARRRCRSSTTASSCMPTRSRSAAST